MSKILLFLLPLGLLVFSGCPRDGDEDQPLTEADLVGTWSVTHFDSEYTVTGNFLGENVDQEGSSQITQSDLQINLTDDGRWTSSGSYTITVSGETNTDVTQQEGIGGGNWSLRSDTVFLVGLQNLAGNGQFANSQACAVTNFRRGFELELTTEMNHRERNADYETDILTRGKWRIALLR